MDSYDRDFKTKFENLSNLRKRNDDYHSIIIKKNICKNIYVSDILSKFNSHRKGWNWYFFGKHNIEFESKYSDGDICTAVKESIKKFMDANKTPVEIISIFDYRDRTYETCKFTVKRI